MGRKSPAAANTERASGAERGDPEVAFFMGERGETCPHRVQRLQCAQHAAAIRRVLKFI